MTHRAHSMPMSAPLHCDFARGFLDRHFAPDVIAALYDAMPAYSRGPRKGLKKGYVHWTKCTKGGWFSTGPGDGSGGPTRGFVMAPGSHRIRVTLGPDRLSTGVLDQEANSTDQMRIDYIRSALPTKAA